MRKRVKDCWDTASRRRAVENRRHGESGLVTHRAAGAPGRGAVRCARNTELAAGAEARCAARAGVRRGEAAGAPGRCAVRVPGRGVPGGAGLHPGRAQEHRQRDRHDQGARPRAPLRAAWVLRRCEGLERVREPAWHDELQGSVHPRAWAPMHAAVCAASMAQFLSSCVACRASACRHLWLGPEPQQARPKMLHEPLQRGAQSELISYH